MLIAAHTLSGAVVGEAVGNPILAFLLGIILHFLLDLIPHFDTTDDGRFTVRQIVLATVDGAIGLTLLIFAYFKFSTHHPGFVAGALGGIMPDLLSLPPFMRNLLEKFRVGRAFLALHEKIQPKSLKPVPGIAVQIIIWALSLYFMAANIV